TRPSRSGVYGSSLQLLGFGKAASTSFGRNSVPRSLTQISLTNSRGVISKAVGGSLARYLQHNLCISSNRYRSCVSGNDRRTRRRSPPRVFSLLRLEDIDFATTTKKFSDVRRRPNWRMPAVIGRRNPNPPSPNAGRCWARNTFASSGKGQGVAMTIETHVSDHALRQ